MTPAPRRVLIVALRRLGDVLLTTPLARSCKRQWPGAAVDMLVFRGTEGVLAGNPDISRVIAMTEKPGAAETWALLRQLGRRYDLAISTQTGDRPTFYAFAAGRRRVGTVAPDGGGRLKRLLLTSAVERRKAPHRVAENLRLALAAGAAPVPEVVPPGGGVPPEAGPAPLAVLHVAPMYRYKAWPAPNWRALAEALLGRGYALAATGGPAPAERAAIDAAFDGLPVHRFDGRLGWPDLAALLRRAALYVGPDTSVTHLAAACGTPTVALFGPTDPRIWGPWPLGGLDRPWEAAAPVQQRNNVAIVQHPFACTPCQRDGCDQHLGSASRCLEAMPLRRVLEAVARVAAQRSA